MGQKPTQPIDIATSLTIRLDDGEYCPRPHLHRVDEAHEKYAAQVQEKVKALVHRHRDLIGQDLGDWHRDPHYDQHLRVQRRKSRAKCITVG